MSDYDELLTLADELDDIADYPGSMKIASRVRNVAAALRAALAAQPEPDDLVWKLAEWITPGGLMGDDPVDWEAAAKRLLASIEGRGPWLPGEAYGPAAAGSATPEEDT